MLICMRDMYNLFTCWMTSWWSPWSRWSCSSSSCWTCCSTRASRRRSSRSRWCRARLPCWRSGRRTPLPAWWPTGLPPWQQKANVFTFLNSLFLFLPIQNSSKFFCLTVYGDFFISCYWYRMLFTIYSQQTPIYPITPYFWTVPKSWTTWYLFENPQHYESVIIINALKSCFEPICHIMLVRGGIYKCICWLNGLFYFLGWWWWSGFSNRGSQHLSNGIMVPRLILNSPNIPYMITSTVYGFWGVPRRWSNSWVPSKTWGYGMYILHAVNNGWMDW